MTSWIIGFSTGCFHHRRIFEVLPEIRESGFGMIEVCSFPPHLDYHQEPQLREAGRLMRELGLQALSFHAPFADRIDITSFDARARSDGVEELLRACDAAAMLNCRYVVLHPGPERTGRPPDREFVQHLSHAAESLNRVAEHCCRIGVHLLLENMLPHLLFGRVTDISYLLAAVKTCDVGACLDTGHAHLAGEMDVIVQKLSGHLTMLHVNDNRGDWDAHLPPGEGTIDWKKLISHLRRSNFQGPLVLELSAPTHEPTHLILSRAIKARGFLKQVFWEQPGQAQEDHSLRTS
jgi:sugar phosphate isomerase/epimerase